VITSTKLRALLKAAVIRPKSKLCLPSNEEIERLTGILNEWAETCRCHNERSFATLRAAQERCWDAFCTLNEAFSELRKEYKDRAATDDDARDCVEWMQQMAAGAQRCLSQLTKQTQDDDDWIKTQMAGVGASAILPSRRCAGSGQPRLSSRRPRGGPHHRGSCAADHRRAPETGRGGGVAEAEPAWISCVLLPARSSYPGNLAKGEVKPPG
jgi:hypothetical protein